MSAVAQQANTAHRALFVGLGSASVVMGAIGIVVPGLPTTVFLLMASYFFTRSSPRMSQWLHNHRVFGPYLEMARNREMPVRAKLVSLAAMWTGISVSVSILSPTAPGIALIVLAAGLAGTAALLFWVRSPRWHETSCD